jgi:hypothetical protein
MRFLPPLVANLLLFLAAFGLGGLFRPLFPTRLLKVDRVATVIFGGLGLLGTLLFLIGLFRFSKPVILAVLLPAALLGLIFIYQEAKGLTSSSPTSRVDVPILPAAVIVFVVLLTFVAGFAQPVGDIRADHISYHFLGPQVWLRDAAIHPVPDETHTSFPAIVEVLYASVMSLGGTRAPELFSVFSLSLLLVAFGLARRMGLDPKGAWWAAALVATMPVVYRGSFAGFNDAILAGFFLLAIRYALDATSPREYALAGLFAGLAMGTKYTGIIVLFLAIVCALPPRLKNKELRKHIAGLAMFACGAIVIAAPWYLRNWLVLGSPIYPPPPALLHFFTPKYMSPGAIDGLAAWVRHGGAGMGHSFWDFLLLPFHFTYHPALFLNGVGGVGVDLLALVPFGILAFRKDLFAKVLLLFVFLQTIIWFVTEQEARFLIHVYVILAVFAIFGWRYVNAKAPRGGPLLSALAVTCSMLYGLFMIVGYRVEDLRAAVSSGFEEQRIAHEVPYLDSFEYLNENPAVKKVLVLAPRFPTFYLRKEYLKPVGRFGEQVVPGAHDTAKLVQNATAMGISHVIDVRVDDKESPVQDFVLQDPPPNLRLIFQREDQRIYQLLP